MKRTDEIDMKKLRLVIAREILVLFGGLILIGAIWCVLQLRNSWHSNKIVSLSEEVNRLTNELDSLPTDYIKEFYNKTNRYFVVHYKLGHYSNAIPKEQEKAFLNDPLGIKPTPTLLPIFLNGYSYVSYKIINSLNVVALDSTVVFDYVTFDKFRELIASEEYVDKLYSVFANKSNEDQRVLPLPAGFVPANFDPRKPYNGTFSLGTLSEFKSKLLEGLSYTENVLEEKKKLETRIISANNDIRSANSSMLSSNAIRQLVYKSLLVIGVLLYPVRLSILLLLWAFRVLKEK